MANIAKVMETILAEVPLSGIRDLSTLMQEYSIALEAIRKEVTFIGRNKTVKAGLMYAAQGYDHAQRGASSDALRKYLTTVETSGSDAPLELVMAVIAGARAAVKNGKSKLTLDELNLLALHYQMLYPSSAVSPMM